MLRVVTENKAGKKERECVCVLEMKKKEKSWPLFIVEFLDPLDVPHTTRKKFSWPHLEYFPTNHRSWLLYLDVIGRFLLSIMERKKENEVSSCTDIWHISPWENGKIVIYISYARPFSSMSKMHFIGDYNNNNNMACITWSLSLTLSPPPFLSHQICLLYYQQNSTFSFFFVFFFLSLFLFLKNRSKKMMNGNLNFDARLESDHLISSI